MSSTPQVGIDTGCRKATCSAKSPFQAFGKSISKTKLKWKRMFKRIYVPNPLGSGDMEEYFFFSRNPSKKMFDYTKDVAHNANWDQGYGKSMGVNCLGKMNILFAKKKNNKKKTRKSSLKLPVSHFIIPLECLHRRNISSVILRPCHNIKIFQYL